MPNYLNVALPVPMRRPFTYALAEAAELPAVGARVKVPFAGRSLVGIVLGVCPHPDVAPEKIKFVDAVHANIVRQLCKLISNPSKVEWSLPAVVAT